MISVKFLIIFQLTLRQVANMGILGCVLLFALVKKLSVPTRAQEMTFFIGGYPSNRLQPHSITHSNTLPFQAWPVIISQFKALLHLQSEPFQAEGPQELLNATASMLMSLRLCNFSRAHIEMDMLVLIWKLKSILLTSQIYLELMVMLWQVRHGRGRAAGPTLTGFISIFYISSYILSQIYVFSSRFKPMLNLNWMPLNLNQ